MTTIDLKKHQNVEWQGTQTIFDNYTYFPEMSQFLIHKNNNNNNNEK